MFLWWVVYMFAVCLHAVKHFMEKKQPTLKWLLYFNIWIEQEKKGTWLRMGKTKYLSLKYKDCHKEIAEDLFSFWMDTCTPVVLEYQRSVS